MDLKTCQHQFTMAMLAIGTVNTRITPVDFIVPHKRLSSDAQLGIYRRCITGAKQRVLGQVFPVCRQILGDGCFNTIAHDYTWHQDTNCSDLNQFGNTFPNYLAQHCRPDWPDEFAYIPDLARLEWHYHQAHFQPALAVPDTTALAEFSHVAFNQLGISINSGLVTLTSGFPIYKIWLNNISGNGTDAVPASCQDEILAIFNIANKVYVEVIDAPTFTFINCCRRKQSMYDSLSAVKDQAESVLSHLPHMLGKGWITGFYARAANHNV